MPAAFGAWLSYPEEFAKRRVGTVEKTAAQPRSAMLETPNPETVSLRLD